MYAIAAQRLHAKGMYGLTLTLCYIRMAILVAELLIIRVRWCGTHEYSFHPFPQYAIARYTRRRDIYCTINRAATCIIGLMVCPNPQLVLVFLLARFIIQKQVFDEYFIDASADPSWGELVKTVVLCNKWPMLFISAIGQPMRLDRHIPVQVCATYVHILCQTTHVVHSHTAFGHVYHALQQCAFVSPHAVMAQGTLNVRHNCRLLRWDCQHRCCVNTGSVWLVVQCWHHKQRWIGSFLAPCQVHHC